MSDRTSSEWIPLLLLVIGVAVITITGIVGITVDNWHDSEIEFRKWQATNAPVRLEVK